MPARPSFNRVILIGALVWEPDLRRTGAGVPFVSLQVLVEREAADARSSGWRSDRIRVVAWGAVAENFARSRPEAGTKVLVLGRLQSWKLRDAAGGELLTEVNAKEIQIVAAGEHASSSAAQLNDVVLCGTLCDAAELRCTAGGSPYVECLLTSDDRWGEGGQARPHLHRLVAWGREAEAVARLEAGATLEVCGRLQSRKRDTQSGAEWVTEVLVREVLFLAGCDRPDVDKTYGVDARSPGIEADLPSL